jgi:Zn-dependent metalloprotease
MASRHRRALIALATTLALAGCGGTPTPAGTAAPAAPSKAAAPAEKAVTVRVEPKPRVTRTAAVDAARGEIRRNATAIKSAPDEKYQAVDTVVDDSGEQHVRFSRTHDGLPVLGGDFVVHSTADGRFDSATVAQDQAIDIPGTAKVSRAEAIRTAALGGRVEARKVVDALAGEPALAWEVTGPARVVIVDAVTGRVRLAYDTVHTAEKGTGHGQQVGDVELSTTRLADGRYSLVDPDHGDNTIRDAKNQNYDYDIGTYDEFFDADNEWGDGTRADRATAGVDVLYGLGETWDYLRDSFGREGVAGDGKGLIAYVHRSVNNANAGYRNSCNCLLFGDGLVTGAPFTSLDVVAHEMAHGLDRHTANLVYSGESGALSEAHADIIGTLVEFAANNPADAPDYLIGEKTLTREPALRRMDEPGRDGKSVSCWTPTAKDLDVHYSSGIGNKFFYNLAVGSGSSQWGESAPCGGAAPVTGIGNDRAAQIWYRAVTVYMVSNTNFAGAREATLRAAADLYGPDSTERGAVDAAWLAVGVDAAQVPNSGPVISPLPYFVTVPQAGAPVRLQVTAREPQGQPVTFSATGLPDGVSIDANGLITGAPTARGLYPVQVTVTDPDGNTDTKKTEFVVKGPVLLQSASPEVITRLAPYGDTSLQAVFADRPDYWIDRSDSFKVTASGFPAGLTLKRIEPIDLGVYRASITGRPTAVGSGTAVLVATDADGNQATASIPWQVLPPETHAAPTTVSVTGGNGTALVEWNPPYSDPWKFPITGYVVRVSPGTETTLDAGARSLTLSGLDTRQAYTVGVRAINVGGDGRERAVSLTPTGLTIAASPTAITYGKTALVTGRVLRDNSPVAGATVVVEHRPMGKTTWSRFATVETDGKGVWRATAKSATTSAIRVRYAGSAGMWPATSGNAWISVRYAVTAKASTTKPKANQKIKISGTAKPARAGVTVTLQYKKGTRWITITSTRTTGTGAYTFSRAFKRGTWTLRTVIAGGSYNATATSTTVKLTVK